MATAEDGASEQQCVSCFSNLSTAEPGRAFPCCGAIYCEGCAREQVENESCAECFKEIDAQGDVDGYVAALPAHDAAAPPPSSPSPSEAPTEPSAPPRPTARELRQQRLRLETIDRRALRLDAAEFLVLDEADQMLDLGFIHALRRIAGLLPAAGRCVTCA